MKVLNSTLNGIMIYNKSLHRTAIPLRSIAAGELVVGRQQLEVGGLAEDQVRAFLRNGRLFVVFSASGFTQPPYCLGLLTHTGGDLLGVTLPRGFPVEPRPGRGWLVDHGDVSVAQLAVDTASTAADGPAVFGLAPALDDPFGAGGRRGSPDGHR